MDDGMKGLKYAKKELLKNYISKGRQDERAQDEELEDEK